MTSGDDLGAWTLFQMQTASSQECGPGKVPGPKEQAVVWGDRGSVRAEAAPCSAVWAPHRGDVLPRGLADQEDGADRVCEVAACPRCQEAGEGRAARALSQRRGVR